MKATRWSTAALLGLSACGSSYTLARTGAPQPARSAGCDFQFLTTRPTIPFIELGIASRGTNAMGGGWATVDVEEFRSGIAPLVCEAGGDAVIAIPSDGLFSKATIIKFDTSAPAPAASAATSAGGCQYDTQCKGDRVCVKGECVSPPSK